VEQQTYTLDRSVFEAHLRVMAGMRSMTVAELERRLRRLDTPVIARIEEGRLLLDVRTVADGEVRELAAALAAALGGTE